MSQSWKRCGVLSEVIVCPILKYDNQCDSILIYQNIGSRKHVEISKPNDFYLSYNITTNKCQQVPMVYCIDDKQENDNSVIFGYKNVYFKQNNKYYSSDLPFSLIKCSWLKYNKYLIIFGGYNINKRQTVDDILIIDLNIFKWYLSNIKLPISLMYLSFIIIPDKTKQSLTFLIIKYWQKILYNINIIKEINILISTYCIDFNVYLFGGINSDVMTNKYDGMTLIETGNVDVYYIDLIQMIENKKQITTHDYFKNIDKLTFNKYSTDYRKINKIYFEDCAVCYDEEVNDCIVFPCRHLICCIDCFENRCCLTQIDKNTRCDICNEKVIYAKQIM